MFVKTSKLHSSDTKIEVVDIVYLDTGYRQGTATAEQNCNISQSGGSSSKKIYILQPISGGSSSKKIYILHLNMQEML